MEEKKFYKLMNKDMCHHGYQYKEGLNIDDKPFDEIIVSKDTKSMTCSSYGLYFVDSLWKLVGVSTYVNGDIYYEVEIPSEYETVYHSSAGVIHGHAPAIIIKNPKKFYTIEIANKFLTQYDAEIDGLKGVYFIASYTAGCVKTGNYDVARYIIETVYNNLDAEYKRRTFHEELCDGCHGESNIREIIDFLYGNEFCELYWEKYIDRAFDYFGADYCKLFIEKTQDKTQCEDLLVEALGAREVKFAKYLIDNIKVSLTEEEVNYSVMAAILEYADMNLINYLTERGFEYNHPRPETGIIYRNPDLSVIEYILSITDKASIDPTRAIWQYEFGNNKVVTYDLYDLLLLLEKYDANFNFGNGEALIALMANLKFVDEDNEEDFHKCLKFLLDHGVCADATSYITRYSDTGIYKAKHPGLDVFTSMREPILPIEYALYYEDLESVEILVNSKYGILRKPNMKVVDERFKDIVANYFK